MSDMKLIMENWNEFLNEEKTDAVAVFYEVCEEKESQRQELLKEVGAAEIHVGGDDGLHGTIAPMGKWSALTAMTGIAAYAGLTAYALNVGGAVGVAFFITGNAVPLAIIGALTYAYFKTKKLLPKWLKRIWPFGTKHDPLKVAQEKIKKMMAAAQERAGLTEDQATALLEIVNKEVNEDEECSQLSEDLLRAVDDNDSDAVRTLTDKLDDAVSGVIQRLQEELKTHMQQGEDPNDDLEGFTPDQIDNRRSAGPEEVPDDDVVDLDRYL